MATISSSTLTSARLGIDYALPHAPALKAMVVSLDPGFLDYYENPADPYLIGLFDSRGYQFDRKNDFWRDSIPVAVAGKIASFDSASSWPGMDTLGYQTRHSARSGWGDTLIDGPDYSFQDSAVQINLGHIRTLADSCARRGVHLFVINFPQNPLYGPSSVVGRYGPSDSTFARVARHLAQLDSSSTYFHFRDANDDGNHDFGDHEALDANHLNHVGAERFGRRVDSLLREYIE
jgi:hypothetical protein